MSLGEYVNGVTEFLATDHRGNGNKAGRPKNAERVQAEVLENALKGIPAAEFMRKLFPEGKPQEFKIDLRSDTWSVRPRERSRGRRPNPKEGRLSLWRHVYGEGSDQQARDWIETLAHPQPVADAVTIQSQSSSVEEERPTPNPIPKSAIKTAPTPDDEQIKCLFEDAMRSRGLIVPKGGVVADGEIQRCDVDKGKAGKNDGAYVLHLDGVPAGGLQNWRDSFGWQDWKHDTARTFTEAEKKAFAARMEKERRDRNLADEQRRDEAAKRASWIWDNAEPAPDTHPYLVKKGVSTHGLRVHKGLLVIPLRDADGNLRSLQFIASDGEKRFLTGGRKSGCFFVIGKSGMLFAASGINPSGKNLIGEGFATMASCYAAADCPAVIAFDSGNLKSVVQALRQKYPDASFTFCADDDAWTEANPGKTKAEEGARTVGGVVAVPTFSGERQKGQTDFNDLHQAEGLGAVANCIKSAVAPADEINNAAAGGKSKSDAIDIDAGIDRLARMKGHEYELVRKEEAKHLGIERVSQLDIFIKKRRAEIAAEARIKERDAELCEPPVPWDEPVDGAQLAAEIANAFRSHVVLPDHTDIALPLWVLHAHAHDAAQISPILAALSPEKRCGKTTLLSVLQELTPNPLLAANITAPAVFRAVEAWRPTLLVDEADTFLEERDELRGVLNSGHNRRSAVIIRVVEIGGEQQPKKFSTWAPKAIAAIKEIPGTLQDRSITIQLRRKLPSEKVQRFRADRVQHLTELCRKAARWALDNIDALREIDAETPDKLHDRAADNWRTLLNIAEHLGGEWPAKARAAALALEGISETDEASDNEALTPGVRLLADCRTIFRNRDAIELSAQDIIRELCDLPENEWCDYRSGKAITSHAFAKLLRPFGIKSSMVTHGEKKGSKVYNISIFKDPWRRYLSHEGGKTGHQSSTISTALKTKDNFPLQSSTVVEDGNSEKHSKNNAVEDVELQNGFFHSSHEGGVFRNGFAHAATDDHSPPKPNGSAHVDGSLDDFGNSLSLAKRSVLL
ncbi:MAG: DUF3631 domain-containing protein [Rhodomicrobium sp.]